MATASNGTRDSSHCCAAPATDCTADNSAADRAASRGALRDGIRYRQGETQQHENR